MHDYLSEYRTLTQAEAARYCEGSEGQRVRRVIRERVGPRTVLDYGCGPGHDAALYEPGRQYTGVDCSFEVTQEASRRHRGVVFFCAELPHGFFPDALGMFDCVVIKSVLEHTPSVEHAKVMLEHAIQIARQQVFVAWHTPPGEVEVLREVAGHSGRAVHQNTYLRADFLDVGGAQPLQVDVEQVDNFELWTITKP